MIDGRTTFSAELFFFDLCQKRKSASACARMQALCAAKRLPTLTCLSAAQPPR